VLTCTSTDGRLLVPRRAPPRHVWLLDQKGVGRLHGQYRARALEETFTPSWSPAC